MVQQGIHDSLRSVIIHPLGLRTGHVLPEQNRGSQKEEGQDDCCVDNQPTVLTKGIF